VKFRNLDETVLKSVQQGGKATNGEGNEALQPEPDSDSDSDDDDDWPESGTSTSMGRRAAARAFTFEIDSDINISAPALLDLVAVTPTDGSPVTSSRAQIVPVANDKPEDVDWNF
jgi:hypothetical protein